MDQQTAIALIDSYLAGKAKPGEIDQFFTLLENDQAFLDQFNTILEDQYREGVFDMEPNEKLRQLVQGRLQTAIREAMPATEKAKLIPFRSGKWVRFRRLAAAAAVLLILGLSSYFLFFDKKEKVESGARISMANDIAPGREGAILTLANGQKIVLDGASDGQLTDAAQKKGAQVVYSAESGVTETNTMTTPKGRQYSLVLADGTKVWLNAGSSITFPTSFRKDSREVAISGEVYFEVTKDPTKPFRVKVNEETAIEVLGTHFNVKAYGDESSINTTLLEGSVRVRAFQRLQLLKPGQQSEIKPGEKTMGVRNVDVEKVMAWKNGFFNFQDVPLPEVMKQLERWYDIEVVYEKGIPNIKFGGKVSNDVSLSGLLRSLQESELHFRMEGRKLIVLP